MADPKPIWTTKEQDDPTRVPNIGPFVSTRAHYACPHCGHENEVCYELSRFGPALPASAITLCGECAGPFVFNAPFPKALRVEDDDARQTRRGDV